MLIYGLNKTLINIACALKLEKCLEHN